MLVGPYPPCTQTSAAATGIFEGGVGNPTRLSTRRSVSGTALATVVVAAVIVVSVVVRPVRVRIVIAASAAGVGASWGRVVNVKIMF